MKKCLCVVLLCVVSGLFVGCGGDSTGPTVAPLNAGSDKSDAANAETVGNIDKVLLGSLTETEVSDGWINLFDGESLFGWTANSDKSNWRVEDGVIVCEDETKSLLQTNFQFADYEFRCDWRLAKGGNSGVFLRGQFKPGSPAKDCYELNMADEHPSGFTTGGLVGRVKAEGVGPTEGEWHTWHIACLGSKTTVKLDDKVVLEFDDTGENARSFGHIGLQMNAGKIEFRNVCLKPLNQTELFDGSSLEGWNEVPGGKSEFNVVDGELSVTNGAGFLETKDTFDNFILQAQVKPNDIALNSGIFFRAMKGTEKAPSHGYEMQIQNGAKDGDATKPADSGTGAIFRRQPARRVNGRDKEWTTTTLIAQGDHIGSWVNGFPVVDWKDDREPNENPRKGKRLKAGHISLQGHDPTTDLRFRNIRISPAPFE